MVLSAAWPALAQPDRPIIQYFEAEWNTVRYRMPDVFMAGYGGVWLPPPTKGQSGSSSIGYDLFDRFDLGSNTAPTQYGTEDDFRLMADAFHAANVEVYVDWLMNHNATKDNSTPGFLAQGGYPGFVLEVPEVDPYGDFHEYYWHETWGCWYSQSTNPGDSCYNLYEGRLVGLIDIAQEKDYPYIRHPVTQGDPDNIPAGTTYNKVDADNAGFYPDSDLTPDVFTNPGTNRNPGSTPYTIYPFNSGDPLQGDAVVENARELLMRSTQWMLEELGVDGFRLDAAKHIPTDFWDTYWDASVYLRHRAFDGSYNTPFSFVEVVEGGGISAEDWVRKPGGPYGNPGQGWPEDGEYFGNRDALDLNEAGALRDLVDADGSNSWAWVMGASYDNRDDGYNNGTIGVHHVNSHDNAIGDTEDDTVAHTYVCMRTGIPIVYHNAYQFGDRPENFPRRNGRDDALGLDNDAITKLVQIRNEYARGYFMPINDTDPVNQSVDDVLVFTRRMPAGTDNLLIAVNDREVSLEVQTRNVATTFPEGTRLHELTGNAANTIVDPADVIPEVLLVDFEGRLSDADNPTDLYLKIPSNRGFRGILHGRGYVIYGPAAPSGTLTVTNVDETIPADDVTVEPYARRLTPIDVIRADSFEIQLQTTQTDPLDPNTDDFAVFRIDSGFVDYNNSAGVDYPTGFQAGYEDFLTENSPLYGGGSGTYRQVIDATQLADGYHYISVWAFRHRVAGDPIIKDFRKVIYIDRVGPQVWLVEPTQTGNGDITTSTFQATVEATDVTVTAVHIFFDKHVSTDFIALAEGGQDQATQDGLLFHRTIHGAITGNHRIDIVAFDELGGAAVQHYVGINATTSLWGGLGDMNNDFSIDGRDVAGFVVAVTGSDPEPTFYPAADFNADGLNDLGDLAGFLDVLLATE